MTLQRPLCLLLLILIPLINSGCVTTIQNAKLCAAAGKLSSGGICSRLTTNATNDLSFNEMLDLIEAQPERTCVAVPEFNVCADNQKTGVPVKLPPRGASFVIDPTDMGTILTELSTMCRKLGSGCSYQTLAIIQSKVAQQIIRTAKIAQRLKKSNAL